MKEIEPDFSLAIEGYTFVGRGPGFGSTSGGWSSSRQLLYRCAKCGSTMTADQNNDFRCYCGAVSLDSDAGRFGSTLGDHNILVYCSDNMENG